MIVTPHVSGFGPLFWERTCGMFARNLHRWRKGEPLENCQKAPNPILPTSSELFWGTLSFLVVFIVMRQFAFPAVVTAPNHWIYAGTGVSFG